VHAGSQLTSESTKSRTWKFDRQKVMTGLLKASEKRPIGMGQLAKIIDDVEGRLSETTDRELSTTEIGEMLMESLHGIDKIAYVRFASVYRDFQDVEAFVNELTGLMRHKRPEKV
jgi:transcriptional repressor NrdR